MRSLFGPRCLRRVTSLPACGSTQAPKKMLQNSPILPVRSVFGTQFRCFSKKRTKSETDMDKAFPFWLDPDAGDDEDMPKWVENVLRKEESETLLANHEDLVRIFTETHNANAIGKKLMPVIRWFATLFRGKAEIERALEEQGLEWKDINILQNWNDADGMLDGSHQVYDKILDFLHHPEDESPDLEDLVLHDVMSELDFFRGQKYKPEIVNFGKLETCVLMSKISCDSEIFDMLVRGDTRGAREALNGSDAALMQALITDSQFTLTIEAFAKRGESFYQHDQFDLRALVNFRKGLVSPFKVSHYENKKWEIDTSSTRRQKKSKVGNVEPES